LRGRFFKIQQSIGECLGHLLAGVANHFIIGGDMGSVNEFGLRASDGGGQLLVGDKGTASLCEYVDVLAKHRSSTWAWGHYKDVLADLLRIRDAKRIMEIGGGRFPLFDHGEIASTNVEYIVNDISAAELDRAPSQVGKACFDIAAASDAEIAELANSVDLTFSKMVFEHVSDTQRAYQNIYKILSPAGICLNFHPVLFSLPFLINYVVPATAAERLLQKFSPRRNRDEQPKFPARYDRCWVSTSLRNTLRSIGYRYVWQLPFWFHEYFVNFPGLYQCDRVVNQLAERSNWTSLASYCYTIVMK
jgi:SAM-dependent methyltransferase